MNIVGMALVILNLNIFDAKQSQKRRLVFINITCLDNNKLNKKLVSE